VDRLRAQAVTVSGATDQCGCKLCAVVLTVCSVLGEYCGTAFCCRADHDGDDERAEVDRANEPLEPRHGREFDRKDGFGKLRRCIHNVQHAAPTQRAACTQHAAYTMYVSGSTARTQYVRTQIPNM
jgi:hypothetical protein